MDTIRRLPRESWSKFLDEFTSERRGAPVLMTIDWAALGEEVEAHDVLLEAVAYDPRADVLEISALRPSASGPTVLRHEISGPEAVEIDSPVGIVPATLRITGADGAVTVARITNPPELSS